MYAEVATLDFMCDLELFSEIWSHIKNEVFHHGKLRIKR